MSRFSWGASKAPARKEPRRVRLELEELEARLVLSATTTYTVAAGDTATLIADINAANTSGAATTINLTAGTYDFTSANNNTFGPNALPVITGDITINGNGAVLERDPSLGQNTPFRIFYISGSQEASPSSSSTSTGQATGSLTLENLTLAGGLAQGGGSDTGGGGLGAGGAIFNMGNLTLNGVTVEQSVAEGGSGGTGTSGSGGGLGSSSTGTSGNFGAGGAVSTTGTGGAGGFGGGGGAGGSGGAGGFGAGAGNGSAGGGGLGAGGAIFNMYGTTTLINSTLASNLAEGGSGGNDGDGYGGAVFSVDGTLNVITSTLADNSTTGDVNGGGAVYNLAMGTTSSGAGVPSTVTLTDSILADSIGSNDLVNDQNDSTAGSAVINATTPNIVMNLSTLDGSTTNGTPNSANPDLGLLLNYGGPTPTMPLLAGSPALGAGASGSNVPTTDQLGNARGSSIDLGAVQDTPATTATGTTTAADTTLTLTNTGSSSSGSSVTLTATVAASSGSTTPAGTVEFVDTTSGATLGSATLTTVNGQAQATLTTTSVSSGDTITATYTSSNNLGGSSGNTTVGSSSSTESTSLNLTSTSTMSASSSAVSTTLTATITAPAGTSPAGTVTFVDTTSGATLGSAAVTMVNGVAQATLTTTSAASGDGITATYVSSNGMGGSSGSTSVGAAISTTQTAQWLNAVYEALLHRPVDATGLAEWGADLAAGTSPTQVVEGIEASTEFQTDEIQSAYQTLLGTSAPSSAVSYLLGVMQQGASFQNVEALIAGSNPFYVATGDTTQGFLNAVYEDFLGRPLDTTGQTEWGSLLAAGYTPTQVVLGIMSTQEYLTDLVEQDYQTYMGRQADPTSLAAYVSALSGGTMNNAMVVASLLGSGEYMSQFSTT
jgi:hypothetical protein